jgi:hypothetical protein
VGVSMDMMKQRGIIFAVCMLAASTHAMYGMKRGNGEIALIESLSGIDLKLINAAKDELKRIEPTQCTECKFYNASNHRMQVHYKMHAFIDNNPNKTIYSCENCGYLTEGKKSIRTHICEFPNMMYYCEFSGCSYTSGTQRSILTHAQSHKSRFGELNITDESAYIMHKYGNK